MEGALLPLIELPLVHVEPRDLLPFLCCPCNRLVVSTCESQLVEALCRAHWQQLCGHFLEAPCALALALCGQVAALYGQRGPCGHCQQLCGRCQEVFGHQVDPCYTPGMAMQAWRSFHGLQTSVELHHLCQELPGKE